MPISLPTSPALNQTYTYGSKTWRWDGTRWNIVYTSILSGSTGPTGSKGLTLLENKQYLVSPLKNISISNLTIAPGNISFYSPASYSITVDSQTGSNNNSTSTITTTNLANNILISPGSTFNNLTSISYYVYASAYGNETYAIGGSGSYFATSTDTITWTLRTAISGTMKVLAYTNSMFIAAGDSRALSTSTNAITWTTRSVPFANTSTQIKSYAYGNSAYVVGGDHTVCVSTDAITWTEYNTTFVSPSQIRSLIYDGSLFMAVGDSGLMSVSTNGITWTTRTSGTGNVLYSLIYANGLYVAAGSGPTIITSTNGTTWTSRTPATGAGTILSLTYGDGVYIAGANSGVAISTSTNGITWTSRTSSFTSSVDHLNYLNNNYYIAGGYLKYRVLNKLNPLKINFNSGVL